MDVRSFMPVSQTIKAKPKKSKSKRKLIINDENGCRVIEKNNDFDVVLDTMIKETKPNIK